MWGRGETSRERRGESQWTWNAVREGAQRTSSQDCMNKQKSHHMLTKSWDQSPALPGPTQSCPGAASPPRAVTAQVHARLGAYRTAEPRATTLMRPAKGSITRDEVTGLHSHASFLQRQHLIKGEMWVTRRAEKGEQRKAHALWPHAAHFMGQNKTRTKLPWEPEPRSRNSRRCPHGSAAKRSGPGHELWAGAPRGGAAPALEGLLASLVQGQRLPTFPPLLLSAQREPCSSSSEASEKAKQRHPEQQMGLCSALGHHTATCRTAGLSSRHGRKWTPRYSSQ